MKNALIIGFLAVISSSAYASDARYCFDSLVYQLGETYVYRGHGVFLAPTGPQCHEIFYFCEDEQQTHDYNCEDVELIEMNCLSAAPAGCEVVLTIDPNEITDP